MPSEGRLEDGTPFMAIGSNEPEAQELIVHCECTNCGKEHYFDLWKMFRGEVIKCEHCGHESKAERKRYHLNDYGEWIEEEL